MYEEEEGFMDYGGEAQRFNDQYNDYGGELDEPLPQSTQKQSKKSGRAVVSTTASENGSSSAGDRSLREETKEVDMGDADEQMVINEISNLNYAQGGRSEYVSNPCTVMMVAEKPSIALSIAEALSRGNYVKKTGIAKSIPIYAYGGKFKGYNANFL